MDKIEIIKEIENIKRLIKKLEPKIYIYKKIDELIEALKETSDENSST